MLAQRIVRIIIPGVTRCGLDNCYIRLTVGVEVSQKETIRFTVKDGVRGTEPTLAVAFKNIEFSCGEACISSRHNQIELTVSIEVCGCNTSAPAKRLKAQHIIRWKRDLGDDRSGIIAVAVAEVDGDFIGAWNDNCEIGSAVIIKVACRDGYVELVARRRRKEIARGELSVPCVPIHFGFVDRFLIQEHNGQAVVVHASGDDIGWDPETGTFDLGERCGVLGWGRRCRQQQSGADEYTGKFHREPSLRSRGANDMAP